MRYDVFISYRRNGGEHLALRVKEALERRNFSVFMDTGIPHGADFQEFLLKQIELSTNLIVILTEGCLRRRENSEDWLLREIRHAMQLKKRIVPVRDSGFEVPSPNDLPEDINTFTHIQGVALSPGEFISKIEGFAAGCLTSMLSGGSHLALPSLVWKSTDQRWEELPTCMEEWNSKNLASTVTLLHVSGWAFRRQRLYYQRLNGRTDIPDSWLDHENSIRHYGIGEEARYEERKDWTKRIEIEIGGNEPWPDSLRTLRVFIGNEDCFADWRKAHEDKLMEKQKASLCFWTEYLKKLKGFCKLPFATELYEVHSLPFYAHIFEYESLENPASGGLAVRLPRRYELDCWHDEPVAFKLRWLNRATKPKEFENLMNSVEKFKWGKQNLTI